MRGWRMRVCRWPASSPCRIPSRPSPRSSGRFLLRAKRTPVQRRSHRTPPFLQPSDVRSGLCACRASDCCRWTTTGDASWPNFPGRREPCPRSWAVPPRPCGRSSANIFSSRCSGRAPNPSRARTRAAWRRCNARRRTSKTLLEDLNRTFHRLRQSGIDEELFDVVSGFEALSGP